MIYRNIQGMRALAALLVVFAHSFDDIAPMRTHWAQPLVTGVGPLSVDIFFVISGFIIYQVMQRTIASMDIVGKGRAIYLFTIKRFIRVYPLYWIVLAVSCLLVTWMHPPVIPHPKPLFKLLTLIDSAPNIRVYVAWTLTFEVYFYAVVALSLLLFAKRAMAGVIGWFVVIAASTVLSFWFPFTRSLNYVFSPILLDLLLGIGVAILIDRGLHQFLWPALVIASVWMVVGSILHPTTYFLRVVHWGVPGAFLIYGIVVLEYRELWIMPRVLQSLGDATFSLYLWHVVVFRVVSAIFVRLGWVNVESASWLTALMIATSVAFGVLAYRYLEKPLLRLLSRRLVVSEDATSLASTRPHPSH